MKALCLTRRTPCGQTVRRIACLFALCLIIPPRAANAAEKLLPWQHWLDVPAVTKPMPELVNLKWASSGGKEGTLTISKENGPWGGPYFQFHVKVDYYNAGKYPVGWPAFQCPQNPPLNFSGWDAIRYWIRVKSKLDRPFPLRFILHTNGKLVINEPIKTPTRDKWVQVTHDLRGKPNLDKVTLLHFFLSESEYKHGDEMTFEIGGFELCKMKREMSQLPAGESAAGLWVGQRAETNDAAVLLPPRTKSLPALLIVQTGSSCPLRSGDVLHWRFREVFSGKETAVEATLGQSVSAGRTQRMERQLILPDLIPGYYLVTADVTRGGKSLLGGRVGCDDFYIRAPGESMTYTVLSIRTGMCQWVRDLLYGDIMERTKIALPHTYDPLNRGTYLQFLDLFAIATGKHTEGNEAGDTGLVYAAEAFRKAGDMIRCRFAEGLLKNSLDHMIAKMQAPDGATITWSNELADKGIGKGGPSQGFGSYDSNQMSEWIRPIARAIVYFARVAGDREYAAKLNRAARKAADYIIAHSTQDSDGIPDVIRHLYLTEKADGSVQQTTYYQEGRQCDVYLGRALSGVSYYAYAMQLIGDKVPDNYWRAFDNTVQWCARKMKPDGWFDWQCGDTVEGGCHTFLGNIYVGEGLFGCYLADRQAGRTVAAEAAKMAALKAYRYVTDDCYIKGKKFTYPLEFWVGPYVYWLFTEYEAAAGPDARMTDWLTTLDNKWRVERGWKDFLQRGGPGLVGRTDTNGMLEISILAYPAILKMQEIGKAWRWEGLVKSSGYLKVRRGGVSCRSAEGNTQRLLSVNSELRSLFGNGDRNRRFFDHEGSADLVVPCLVVAVPKHPQESEEKPRNTEIICCVSSYRSPERAALPHSINNLNSTYQLARGTAEPCREGYVVRDIDQNHDHTGNKQPGGSRCGSLFGVLSRQNVGLTKDRNFPVPRAGVVCSIVANVINPTGRHDRRNS